jgi:HEAT repeat protein
LEYRCVRYSVGAGLNEPAQSMLETKAVPIVMIQKQILTGALALLLSLGGEFDRAARAAQRDDAAAEAIQQLWSSNRNERTRAKARLLELGRLSVPALLALLQDLLDKSGQRYSLGNEERGRAALERWHHSVDTGDKDGAAQAYRDFSRWEITSRLREDAIFLLGALRAEEAVPLLIDIMAREEADSPLSRYEGPEMVALEQIGSAAVPMLLEVLETPAKAERAPAGNAPSTASGGWALGQHGGHFEYFKARSRAAMVLGEIGDIRALPVLQDMLASNEDSLLAPYLKEAINRIRKRTN